MQELGEKEQGRLGSCPCTAWGEGGSGRGKFGNCGGGGKAKHVRKLDLWKCSLEPVVGTGNAGIRPGIPEWELGVKPETGTGTEELWEGEKLEVPAVTGI